MKLLNIGTLLPVLLVGCIPTVDTGTDVMEIYKQDFVKWLEENIKVTTGMPGIDTDFFNSLRVSTKDKIFTRGNQLLDKKNLECMERAESISLRCDRDFGVPIPIPPFILKIRTLKTLFLKNMMISSSIKDITELSSIETIELHSCFIEDLTCLLKEGSGLKKLVLCNCKVENGYADIKRIPKLKELIIKDSDINTINSDLFTVKSLKKVDLSGCNIIKIPVKDEKDEFHVEELNLSRNRLESLPKIVKFLKSVKKLNLSDNIIEKAEDGFEFSDSHNLEELLIERNAMKKLPAKIEHLKKLKVLNAASNLIEEIDSNIIMLPEIKEIDLGFNNIKSLKESFKLLGTVKRFILFNWIPEYVPVKLEKLNLAYNKLESLPPSAMYLRYLKTLNMQGNLLKSIPDEVYRMKKLETLNLAHNKLTKLSSSLASLPRLYELDITGGTDFRTTKGATNQFSGIHKSLLTRASRRMMKIKAKDAILEEDNSWYEYGKKDLREYFKKWVEIE